MTSFSDLIGVSFAYGGRGPDSYDCWGLVQECYRRWHGVEIPDYRSTSDIARNARLILAESRRLWRPVDRTIGAVLVMRVEGVGAHVGFQSSATRFLQALEGQGVVQSRLTIYHNQIIGAYLYDGPVQ